MASGVDATLPRQTKLSFSSITAIDVSSSDTSRPTYCFSLGIDMYLRLALARNTYNSRPCDYAMSRPAHPHRGRAQKRSRMGALAPTEGSSLRASSTTGHLSVSAMTTSEGSCGLVHEASCHMLVCGGPKTQTMMQGYASAASSEAADPFLPTALKPS